MPLKSKYWANFYVSRPMHFYFYFITIVLLKIPLFRVNKYQLKQIYTAVLPGRYNAFCKMQNTNVF